MTKAPLCVVSLNTWGDCTGKILYDIERLSKGAHVMCFQEVHNSSREVPEHIWPKDPGKRTGSVNTKLFTQINELLAPDFIGYYAPQMRGYLHDSEQSEYASLEYGNALFIRSDLKHHYRDAFIYGHMGKAYDNEERTPAGKTGQAVDIYDGNGIITVGNAHGAWFESNKSGNFKWRTLQAENILRLMAPNYDILPSLAKYAHYNPRAILVGDLNVVSATKTVKMIAQSLVFGRNGGHHLNSRYSVWSTRTDLYTGETLEADHAFASPNLEATISVDYTVESDHAGVIVKANQTLV